MSSYQFVNSLTSCYGQPRAGPETGATSGPPADYYTPQVYNNCYSSAANNAVSAATAQPTSPAYSAYLQQNGDHHSTHHHSSHSHVSSAHHRDLHPYTSNSCSQSAAVVQSRLSHHTSAAIIPTRTPTSPSSCKYAVDSASSPQDLSTSSGGAGQSPEPRATPPLVGSQRGSSGSAQPGQQQNNQNTAQQQGTNTTQGNGANGGGQLQSKNGNYGSGNPPHIYPWMRKVHVGQSKSKCLFNLKLYWMLCNITDKLNH